MSRSTPPPPNENHPVPVGESLVSTEITRASLRAPGTTREGSFPPPADVGVAAAVHELQNVLTSVRGWAELARTSEDPALTARALTVIERGVARASALAGAMIDPVRRFGVRAVRFDLRATVARVVELLEARAKSMNIALEYDHGEETEEPVVADPERVEQVLTNLCINGLLAVDAARSRCLASGKVTLSLGSTADTVTVTVSDDGTGIEPSVRAKIFEPFFSGRVSEDSASGVGRGLGLAVSRALAEAMGGRIDVTPGSERGTVMVLTLLRSGSRPSGEFALTGVAGSVDLRVRTGLRVLVLDDEAAIRELLEVALSLRGARVFVAAGTDVAMKFLARGEIDVVLADESLGTDISGALFLREVGESYPRVGRVLMTGADDAGAWSDTEVVRKPFLLDDVVRALAVAMQAV